MKPQRKLPTYKDVNANYVDDDPDAALTLVYDEEDINNSIIALITTVRRRRVFRRRLGTRLLDLLFENITDHTASAIQFEIRTAVEQYEPRIQLSSVVVMADIRSQTYFVQIQYVIPMLDNKSVDFRFNLDRQAMLRSNR